MSKKKLTYISLFSSAGIGCHGFKLENFECVATNELLKKRIQIQKYNNKCKYDTGYVCGDISLDNIKDQIFNEIIFWKKKENLTDIDVIIATPPCQGMSVANHKKTNNEIKRNSLVIESIKIIKKIKPKIFIFENVASFMKTLCTNLDGNLVQIGDAINENFSKTYSIFFDTINFKNYGSNSSRTRTIVIGVRNDYANSFSPLELFPDFNKEKTVKEVIGNLQSLKKYGEIDDKDIFHGFRTYSKHMREWISELKEGQSAFDNKEPLKIPHRIINNTIIYNKNANGDKYKRQYWSKVGQCVHTRNDQLASQNTIHPSDDRVFSIRELMKLMTIPDNFKWSNIPFENLNQLSFEEKTKFLKKEEMNIRQSIGEAVPTNIFNNIAKKIKTFLNQEFLSTNEIKKIVDKNNLNNKAKLTLFINENFNKYTFSTLCKIVEIANLKRLENAGYYTDKNIINEIFKTLPNITNNEKIRILEPSVGTGNFLPFIFKKFAYAKKVILDVVDIDKDILQILKILMKKNKIPKNFTINYINADFLTYEFKEKYDLIIGNPPFTKLKLKKTNLQTYKKNVYNTVTKNIFSFFLEKSLQIGNYVSLITPKTLLNTPEFSLTRELIEKKQITHILDFGEKGFPGILIETICINILCNFKPNNTKIISLPLNIELNQKQQYICDKKMPYWIIYRDTKFDNILKNMELGIFDVFRDRQINKSMIKNKGEIQILKSKNISDDGTINSSEVSNFFIDYAHAKKLGVYKYLNLNSLYLTPNMTYKPRVTIKPPLTLVDGSVAILIPKKSIELTKDDMLYYSSDEYRNFYKIARNFQTRSLNIDSNSVFFFGKKINNMVG